MVQRYIEAWRRVGRLLLASITLTLPMGCGDSDEPIALTSDDHRETQTRLDRNLIDVGPSVRRNLGITFVRVERRPVRSTIRIPGRFELRPEARREYRATLSGRVHLSVKQYESVEVGDLLFELDSPAWRRVQSRLAEAYKAYFCCVPELDAARAAMSENDAQIAFLKQRIDRLSRAGSRNVALDAELFKLKTSTPRLDAQIRAKEADRKSAFFAYQVLLNEAYSLTEIPRDKLEEQLPEEDEETLAAPFWSTVDRIVVRAVSRGIVNEVRVTDSGRATEGGLVLETIDPTGLRFHADALQTDIDKFATGQSARIVPSQGSSVELQNTIDGKITLGFQAHPQQRTIPIFLVPEELPGWGKAGVTAYLEVFTSGRDDEVLAIPEAVVVRDGLDRIFFRRDPTNPNQVIRTVADLGVSDDRWVEVRSGVMPGDEIVLGGVYPLMLASSTSGERQKGGHFHPDGTFHQGEEK